MLVPLHPGVSLLKCARCLHQLMKNEGNDDHIQYFLSRLQHHSKNQRDAPQDHNSDRNRRSLSRRRGSLMYPVSISSEGRPRWSKLDILDELFKECGRAIHHRCDQFLTFLSNRYKDI